MLAGRLHDVVELLELQFIILSLLGLKPTATETALGVKLSWRIVNTNG